MTTNNENIYLTELKESPNPSYFIAKSNIVYNIEKKKVLDYLIKEETKFSDLEKIESSYKHESTKLLNFIDKYDTQLELKRKKLQELNYLIKKEATNNFKLSENEELIIFNFERKKKEILEKIRNQEHTNQCYNNLKKRLSGDNNFVFKNLTEQQKIESINKDQYEKYLIINENALRSFELQKRFLKDMNDYKSLFEVKSDYEVQRKRKTYNKLELTVLDIINLTKSDEKKLLKIRDDIVKITEESLNWDSKIKKIRDEYSGIFSDYYNYNIKLHYIFTTMKANNLQEIVDKFVQLRINYQSSLSMICNFNKEIVTLNNTYTELATELSLLHKLSNSPINENAALNQSTALNDQSFTDEGIIRLNAKIVELKANSNITANQIKSKERLIENIVTLLTKYDSYLKEVKSIIYRSVHMKSSVFSSDYLKRYTLDIRKIVYDNQSIMQIINSESKISYASNNETGEIKDLSHYLYSKEFSNIIIYK